MIKFNTISIQNFLSYGNAPITLNLNNVGTTLVLGEDLDNTASGMGANGVGKTTWVNALAYALFGKPISNISMDNLVNNVNNKNMRVEVEFEKSNKIITVRRARKEKGNGNYAKVFIRDIGTDLDEKEHDKTPDSVANINDFIVDYLGIPYELFVRIVTFTASHVPFLELTLRQQLDMMEELFNLTQLSVKADSIKATMKDTKQKLEIKIRHNEQLEVEHERHGKQLQTAEARVEDWEQKRLDNITQFEAELSQFQAVPIEEQEALYKRVDKLNAELIKEQKKQKTIEGDITEASTKLTVVRAQLQTVQIEKDKIIAWKAENVQAIVDATKLASELPKEHFLIEQRELLDILQTHQENIDEMIEKEESVENGLTKIGTKVIKLREELSHLLDAKCPYCSQQYKDATAKIKECEDSLAELSNQDVDDTLLLELVRKNIKTEEVKLESAKEGIELSGFEIFGAEQDRKNSVKRLEELYANKCPHGDVKLIGDMMDAVISLEKDVTKYHDIIEEHAGFLVEIDDIVDNIEADIKKTKRGITIDSLDQLYEIKNEIKQVTKDINDTKQAENPHIDSLQELKDLEIEKIDMKSINELNNLITHQNYLVKLLTKKDSFIRKNLLTKNITFLNQRLAHYLTELGLPHKVEFMHDMTANISQFGRELDFGNLSSGQKARVNLALSFSFRDVLQKSHDTINVCILDEVLDVGLDTIGVQSAARMLKRKAIDENLALYIISHRDEVSNIFDNKMVIVMEKGFSSIKEE